MSNSNVYVPNRILEMKVETITIDNEEQEEKNKSKRYRIPHQCEQCGKSYAVKKALQDHIAFTHQGIRKYECQECKRCFELSTTYKKHLLCHTELTFQCETCGHTSRSKQNYEIHKRKHTGEKPYVCEQCSAKFADLSSLIAHRKMHSGEAKVMCTFCGKQISNQKNLKRHIAQMHSGRVKPVNPNDQFKLKCQLCDGRFSKLANLNRHMKQKHTDPPSDEEAPAATTSGLNNFSSENLHNLNSFLFPQHGSLFGAAPTEDQGENIENGMKMGNFDGAKTSQHLNVQMEGSGEDVNDSSNFNNDHLPNYDSDEDSKKKIVCAPSFNEMETKLRLASVDKQMESSEKRSEDGEDEREMIYAGDFLKEDDIKEEIKEEIDSDDFMDEDCDSDDYMNENEEEEEEDYENAMNKCEVKEEENSNKLIKEEAEDSSVKVNQNYIQSHEDDLQMKNESTDKKKKIKKSVAPSINACQFCGKIFRFRNSMYRHERKHTGVKYECEICGESYQNKYYLKHHKCTPGDENRRRPGKKKEKSTYTCHVCGNIYQNNESLKNHINIIHNGQRNFPCDICGKLFTRARTMKTHRKNIHNDIKQFNCIYCNSAYAEKRNLMNHIKKNHPGSELMFRRITPQGEAIMDDKTSISQVSLSPIKDPNAL